MRTFAETSLNVRLTGKKWKQATLPTNCGGLGLRTAPSLALSSFLAACASSSHLAEELCLGAPDTDKPRALQNWSAAANGANPPAGAEALKSAKWSDPLMKLECESLLDGATPRDAARLNYASTHESATFFSSTPSTREGTRFSDSVLSCAIGLRLGAEVAALSVCECGAELDTCGDHALCCHRGSGKHVRHAEVNARIKRALADAGVASTLEPVGLDVANGKRPDGTTVLPFARGREMAWYATICHTCAPTYIPAAAATPRAAAETAEGKKLLKYTSIADRVDFPAVGLETLGAFGPSARALLDEIAMKIRER